MTKVYLFKIQDDFSGSDFSREMSLKYNDLIARNRSNYMWYKLEQVLKLEYNITLLSSDIIFGEHNKPMLKNNNIYFNISHSKDLGIIGISDKEIGVDIEMLIADSKLDYISKYFGYNNSIDNISLTKEWVLYESKCKLTGDGLPLKYKQNDVICQTYEENFKHNELLFFVSIAYNDNKKLGGINYDL